MGLVRPALITYAFAPRWAEYVGERERVRSYLESHWRACEGLGLTEPLEGFPFRRDLAPAITPGHAPSFRILAARRRPRGQAVDVAVVFTLADTVGLIVIRAPNEGTPAATWRDLYETWLRALRAAGRPPRPDAVFGESAVFTALASPDTPENSVNGLVAAALPAAAPDGRFFTDEGISLWEAPRGFDRRRKIVAIAPEALERELDHLLWWDQAGGRSLPAFAEYLLSASKVRHAYLLLVHRLDPLRERGAAVDREVADLLELLGDRSSGRSVLLTTIVEAQNRLIQAQGEAGGLLRAVTRLRELKETVRIAEENMRRVRPLPKSPSESSAVFETDEKLAEWVRGQIDHELVYAEARKERADEARLLTSSWLQDETEAYARQQNRLTLYQTAILSSLLAALAVIETINSDLDSEDLPIVVLVGALALALPPLMVHFFQRYTLLDRVTAGVLGAAVGWLVAVESGLAVTSFWSGAVVVLGFASFAALTFLCDWWIEKRRR